MTADIHLYLSSNEKLTELRQELEKEHAQANEKERVHTSWQLADVNEEIQRRLDSD